MVEFALVGPLGFLLLLGIIVLGVVILTQVQLSNAVRTGARAAAVCGSNPGGTTTLPNGAICSDTTINAYITSQVRSLHSNAPAATVSVLDTSGVPVPGSGSNSVAKCVKGDTVALSEAYDQPLFLPLVGNFFGNASTNTRTITVQAEATCEQ